MCPLMGGADRHLKRSRMPLERFWGISLPLWLYKSQEEALAGQEKGF
jgi:hypothetical protein